MGIYGKRIPGKGQIRQSLDHGKNLGLFFFLSSFFSTNIILRLIVCLNTIMKIKSLPSVAYTMEEQVREKHTISRETY